MTDEQNVFTPTDPALVDAVAGEFERLRQLYASQGMAKDAGLGDRPAVLSIDLNTGFTDPDAPMGIESLAAIASASRPVLDAARDAGLPVILVGSSYDADFVEAGAWERKVTHAGLTHGSRWVEFDDRLGRTTSDQVVTKRYPSGFAGTDLVSRLVSSQVDTVILTGAATSGCIRATAVDAVGLGFRVAVVTDAVGDRQPLAHLASLFDVGTKYADLITAREAVDYLNRF